MARKKSNNKPFQIEGDLDDLDLRYLYTYQSYLRMFKQYSVSMFEWKNLPESIDPWFLETCLYERGKAVFFKDPILGFLTTRVAQNGQWNIYRTPISFYAESDTGYYRNLTEKDAVIIYSNSTRDTFYATIQLYARRLAEVQLLIDLNIRGQKFPPMILQSNEKMQSAKVIMQQYQGNEPAIFADIDFDPKSMSCVNLQIPYLADKLQAHKHELMNEAYTILGIENANTDKRERLIRDEVLANRGQVESARNNMLFMRKMACEKINKMFGLNVDVSFRDKNEDYQIREVDDGGEL